MFKLPLKQSNVGRNLNIVLWLIQVLLALAFFAAGGAKVAGVEQMVALFDQIGVGQWFRYVTGSIELFGGAALLVPRLVPYASIVLALTMVGAFVTHLFVIGGNPLPAAFLATLAGFVAYGRIDRS